MEITRFCPAHDCKYVGNKLECEKHGRRTRPIYGPAPRWTRPETTPSTTTNHEEKPQ